MSAFGQGSNGTTQGEARQLGRISQKKQSIAPNLSPSLEKWISITHKIIVQLILPWPYFRPQLLGMLETISSTRLKSNLY